MASSLSTVMEIPEIAAAITSCNEILPGMPASRANLKRLLDTFDEDGHGDGRVMVVKSEGPEWLVGVTVVFATLARRERKQRKRFFNVTIRSAEEWASCPGDQFPCKMRCTIGNKEFDFTEDGLVAAIVWAKERAGRLSTESYRPSCRVDGPVLDQRPALGFPPKEETEDHWCSALRRLHLQTRDLR